MRWMPLALLIWLAGVAVAAGVIYLRVQGPSPQAMPSAVAAPEVMIHDTDDESEAHAHPEGDE